MQKTYDTTALDSLLDAARQAGITKGEMARDLGVKRGTISGWISPDEKIRHVPLAIYQRQFPTLEARYRRKAEAKNRKAGTLENGIEEIPESTAPDPNIITDAGEQPADIPTTNNETISAEENATEPTP